MKKDMIENIVECMSSDRDMSVIQRIQTEHRLKLVQAWGIQEGSRVLEIGCGQGDTTAALAYIVGQAGFVKGVDIASPDYGAPITLGDAARYLQQSTLGKQINMEFNVDVLAADVDFPEDSFDYIVFSHCSWYLKSFEELEGILRKVRKWGKGLRFAEWDARIQTIEQYPHFLAVLIQSQYECFKESSLSNIRTLFTPGDVKRIAESAGWTIIHEQSIHSPQLQDAEWEIAMTLDDYKEEIHKLVDVPDKLKYLIQSEVTLLEQTRNHRQVKPMSTYVFSANRS
ncbi:class I SAM-dependent methyltransferase [Sporosarcina sp. YIM B06819]|uniref:class I SAM-dependent methyltransferase n=1 Tax=Sporosarcina sp. YIM B06819 TaxID=3081769 RepID=UPI00298D1C7A|nr:class I SAM-dependent methyltransferase [Sporosarcina sp. YIM B06819]